LDVAVVPSKHHAIHATVPSRGQLADEHAREQAEQPILRLGRMFAALSATNEAILRTTSPEELYQEVCDAAVYGGKLNSATVLLARPGTMWMTVAATTGAKAADLQMRISIDPELPEGRGLVGIAFRTQQPCAANDFLSDSRTRPWRELARARLPPVPCP
jgi:GAF domain-containing protein